jgi:cell division protein FtsB
MGAAVGVDVDALKAENEHLKAEVAALREKVAMLSAPK